MIWLIIALLFIALIESLKVSALEWKVKQLEEHIYNKEDKT